MGGTQYIQKLNTADYQIPLLSLPPLRSREGFARVPPLSSQHRPLPQAPALPQPCPAPCRPIPGSAPCASQWRPRGPAPGRPPRRPRPAALLASFRIRGGSIPAPRLPGEEGGVPRGNRPAVTPAAGSGAGARAPGLLLLGAGVQGRAGIGRTHSSEAAVNAACARRAGVVHSGLPRARPRPSEAPPRARSQGFPW